MGSISTESAPSPPPPIGVSGERNFSSSTIWIGDNLDVMRGLNSGCVDLIYLDPPFNSNRQYGAPIGSKAAGATFKDMWTLDDVKDEEHGLLADKAPPAYKVIEAAYATAGHGMQAYLIFMAVRLLEMKRLMKPTASIYVHCDNYANSYLRLLMDAIFGRKCFQNSLIWWYGGGGASKKHWGRKHDTLLFYSNGEKWTFNVDEVREKHKWDKGQKRADGSARSAKGKIPDDVIKLNSIMPWAKERTGYPTQKPLALLERIITASSNPNDLVFDPFCGCATTLVAAQRLTRDWIGCDESKMAVTLVNERIRETQPLFKAINPDRGPRRTDIKGIPNYKNQGHLLYGQQEGICNGCNLHFPYGGMSVDHKQPQSKGGTDEFDNLQLLCMRCNSSKGNKTMAEWNAARKKLL